MTNRTDMVIDMWLYIDIGVCGAAVTILSSDEAYKYVAPYLLFYGKMFFSLNLAGASAAKMFRSTTFSDHKDSIEGSSTQTKHTESTNVVEAAKPVDK